MPRRIAVAAYCHTGGIAASLAAMLPGDTVTPCWTVGDPDALRAEVDGADVWVTALPDAEIEAVAASLPGTEPLAIPNMYFRGFHPDLVSSAHIDGAPLPSPLADYHSGLVLWGWKHGLGAEAILDLFEPRAMAAVGYFDAWPPAVARLRSYFEGRGFDFDAFFLPLRRVQAAFMLSDNHPRIAALVQLSRQIAARIGADAELVRFAWEDLLPDALLATGPVWPVYPPVAEHLGLRGGYRWRRADGGLLGLAEFVDGSLAAYAGTDPATVHPQAFTDPRWAALAGARAG